MIPFEIIDLEKGFINLDHFRTVLLEHGFKFELKELGSQPESWSLYDDGKKDFSHKGVQIYLTMNFLPERKVIIVTVKKTIFSEYADTFLNNVKKYYPEKRLEPKPDIKDGKVVGNKGYVIIYTRKDSNLTVGFDQNDNGDYVFTFSLPKKSL